MLIRQTYLKYFYFTYTFIFLHSELNAKMSNVKFAVLDTLLAVSHPTDSHRMFLNFLDELTTIFLQNILWNFTNFSRN